MAKDVFSEVFPNANIIDPSEAVVNQIKKVCPPNIITRSTINWYTTGQVVRLKNQIKKYMGIDTNPIKLKI